MKSIPTNLSAGLLLAALAMAATSNAAAQEYTFTTLAGPDESPGAVDGTASAARFYQPWGVAVDSAGIVYVADTGNNTIRKVTPGGVVTTLAGLAGSSGSADGTGSAARFFYPMGVAVDSAGNVYVADHDNCTIRKVTPGGAVTTLAGLAGSSGSADGTGSAARFFYPEGVAVDRAGNVFVADTWNQTIRKVTPGGVVTTLAGLAGSSGSADGTGSAAWFFYPEGVAVDRAGNVFVADTWNQTIRKVTPGGVVTTLAGLAGSYGSADGTGSVARFCYPSGVAVDSAANVYVGDSENCTIRKVTPGGVVTTLAGLAGAQGSADGTGSAARFNAPYGVALDSADNVYVADSNNQTIRKVTPGGVVTTPAGLAVAWGSADGTGSAARFAQPCGVAVDSAGNVLVADSDNHTIRKVTPGGAVTTLAGLAGSAGSADGTGSAARFFYPEGVAVDRAGNVFVADTVNSTIRKVTPGGVVTTLAGLAGSSGSADGTASAARFNVPSGVAVDSAGNVYVAACGNNTIRIGATNTCLDAPTIDLAVGPVGETRQLDTSPQTAVAWQWSVIRRPADSVAVISAANIRNPTFTPEVGDLYVFRLEATNAAGAICIRTLDFTAVPPPPSITTPPLTQTAEMGSLAFFSVEVTNTPPESTYYQWYFSGTKALGGATNSYLDLTNVQPVQAGAYTVVVTNLVGAVTSDPALLSVIPPVERKVVPAVGLPGGTGTLLHLEYADSLVAAATTWSSFTNVTLTSGTQLCFDLSQPLPAQRFYRAWQTSGPQPALVMSMATEIPLTGAIGSSVRIDYINQFGPTNAWVRLDTITLTTSPQLYFDATAFRQPPRLYRLRVP